MADKAADKAEESIGPGGSLEQVREILFGAQQREMQTRFGEMDRAIERIARTTEEQVDEARRSLERRLEELQSGTTERLDALSERIEETLAAMRKEMAANSRSANERITEMERSLRADLEAQSRQSQQRISDVRADLETAVRRIESEKTGRAELGTYLVELGMRLAGETGSDDAGVVEQPVNGKADGSSAQE